MVKISSLIFFIITIFQHNLMASISEEPYEKKFFSYVVDTGSFLNHTKVSYTNDRKEIGFCYYTKVPIFSYYVIHSFYIYPEFRNKGNGRKLILYICELLKNKKAKKIYIQPGPFELEKNLDEETYKKNTQKLIIFYKSVKFDFVNKFLSKFAYFLYKILGLKENSDYLMVKEIV